jgi:hypothetical protein
MAWPAAQRAVVFSDNFDTGSATTALNFNAFNNWTVVNHPAETVDYLRSGSFGISCAGGTGGCVDLDGSSGSPGRMVSNTIFSFEPGVQYVLSALVSGNQRGVPNDTFVMGIEGGPSVTYPGISPSSPFTNLLIGFTLGGPLTGRLFVEDSNAVGDFFGPILDNVSLSDNRALPEPGTLGLLGFTLAGLALGRRGLTTGHSRRL